MQIGADIYGDTQVILRELERRQPAPTFFPGLAKGLAEGTAFWADHELFSASVAVAFGLMGEHMPDSFLEDRSKFSGRSLDRRSEEHTSELQSLMRISYAVFCLKKKMNTQHQNSAI